MGSVMRLPVLVIQPYWAALTGIFGGMENFVIYVSVISFLHAVIQHLLRIK